MKHSILTILFACAAGHCAGTNRDPQVVAAEEAERKKPLLNPPGGAYFGGVDVSVANFTPGLEYSTGGEYMPLTQPFISLRGSAQIRVRPKTDAALVTAESYRISASFENISVDPLPGSYTTPQIVSLAAAQKNVTLQVRGTSGFENYDAELGVAIAKSSDLEIRQCAGLVCAAPVLLSYQITLAVNPALPHELSTAEVQQFAGLARGEYNQNLAAGLAAQMDAAKLLVIRDNSLMPSAAMRQRFLAQNNTTAAAEACTTVARYLYTWARRLALGNRQLPAFPDFPHYYITHIVRGDITVDGAGQNYVWVANGVAPVTQYLPADALAAYEFQRGTSYPTDYSLIDKLAVTAPAVSLLRDGPSGASHTHTFFVVKTPAGYAMVDTYFNAFNGVDVRASAGKAWPYAFRFGPAGSRYLHFVYGY